MCFVGTISNSESSTSGWSRRRGSRSGTFSVEAGAPYYRFSASFYSARHFVITSGARTTGLAICGRLSPAAHSFGRPGIKRSAPALLVDCSYSGGNLCEVRRWEIQHGSAFTTQDQLTVSVVDKPNTDMSHRVVSERIPLNSCADTVPLPCVFGRACEAAHRASVRKSRFRRSVASDHFFKRGSKYGERAGHDVCDFAHERRTRRDLGRCDAGTELIRRRALRSPEGPARELYAVRGLTGATTDAFGLALRR